MIWGCPFRFAQGRAIRYIAFFNKVKKAMPLLSLIHARLHALHDRDDLLNKISSYD